MPLILALGRQISVSSRPAWSTGANFRTARDVTQRNLVLKRKTIIKAKKEIQAVMGVVLEGT